MTVLAYIALGGILGTVARYGLQGWIQTRADIQLRDDDAVAR